VPVSTGLSSLLKKATWPLGQQMCNPVTLLAFSMEAQNRSSYDDARGTRKREPVEAWLLQGDAYVCDIIKFELWRHATWWDREGKPRSPPKFEDKDFVLS
jgi:hypothetical protein